MRGGSGSRPPSPGEYDVQHNSVRYDGDRYDLFWADQAGTLHELQTHTLRQEMQADAALQKLLLRYTQATLSAVAQSAACNRLHLLEQRCARWLLACHDRAEADTFPMTQKFLALMLGVRRPGVTLAARSLREHGLITYNHGTISVLDRRGLEAAACECNRIIRDQFARVFA